MSIKQLSITCVGIRYPNKKGGNRQFEIAVCERGEPVTLEHEPRNPADQNAIKVISCRGVQMGYISAERTSIIHKAWRQKRTVRAIFQNAYPDGCWIRVGIDEEPMLGPAPQGIYITGKEARTLPSTADPESGFWPDGEYPDQ